MNKDGFMSQLRTTLLKVQNSMQAVTEIVTHDMKLKPKKISKYITT